MNYLVWHYLKAPRLIISIIGNYIYFIGHVFSVSLLFHTLLYPWKRLIEEDNSPGFHPTKLLNTIAFNVISRVVGVIIRLATLFLALLCEVVVILLGSVVFILWFFTPFFTFPLFINEKKQSQNEGEIMIKKSGHDADKLFALAIHSVMGEFLFRHLQLEVSSQPQTSVSVDSVLEINTKKEAFTLPDIFYALSQRYAPFTRILETKGLKPMHVVSVCRWYEKIIERKNKKRKFWTKENLCTIPGIGKDWTYGFTPILDQYTINLGKEPFSSEKFVGRTLEIEAIERVLVRKGNNNVLLLGEPGVGRHTILLGLATHIAEEKTVPELLYKRVLLIDMHRLATGEQVATEQKIIAVLAEAKKAGNIVLVIPSFDQFISNGQGRIDLTAVFSEHLQNSDIQIIGVVDKGMYEKYIGQNATVQKLFSKVEVSEIKKDDSLEILENLALDLEEKYKTTITLQALVEIIKQSDDVITDVPFPEKAIDLLEEVVVFVQSQNVKVVLPQAVDDLLTQKTRIPLGELKTNEKETLTSLEIILHERVVDQDSAIEKIAKALRRKRAGIEEGGGAMGTFLFLGPTGVGKTETAKALAQAYFGSEESLIRLDMAQFQRKEDIQKLIGDNQTNVVGLLTTAVREKPFSVVLLDEFEKADPNILNLFLTVFDEAYLTDGWGKRVSFRHCIIIATSNVGSEFIREEIQKGIDVKVLEKALIDYLLQGKIFTPELVNRFDSVTFFKPLGEKELHLIARMELNALNKKLKEEKEVTIVITDDLIKKLVRMGYDPVFGARNLRRMIKEQVEDAVASKILSGTVEKGSAIEIPL